MLIQEGKHFFQRPIANSQPVACGFDRIAIEIQVLSVPGPPDIVNALVRRSAELPPRPGGEVVPPTRMACSECTWMVRR